MEARKLCKIKKNKKFIKIKCYYNLKDNYEILGN